MKPIWFVLASLSYVPQFVFAQPFVPDSNAVALWHFDEVSGNIVTDTSPFHNNGTAYGATIVPGRFGNGRYFNGTYAFADVPNPLNGSLNFQPNQSFTIEAWFKSTAGGVQEIVRRGLRAIPRLRPSAEQRAR